MFKFLVNRLILSVPTILLVVTLVFLAFQIIPGDPARLYVGEQATLETVENVRKEMGLDKPIFIQYINYIKNLIRGDLGTSFMTRQPVWDVIFPRFIETSKLAIFSIILAVVLGVSLGLLSATRLEGFTELFISLTTILGISIPVFWLALILMYVFGIKLRLLPLAGSGSIKHLILPSICLAVYNIALITRMTRSSVLEILHSDYVRTAKAKGLTQKKILFGHVLKNALIPIITVIGLRFGYLFGGAVITETVFAWPGMGRLLVTSVGQRDIPVIQGCLLIFAILFVAINLFVDLLYGVVDPRIRLSDE